MYTIAIQSSRNATACIQFHWESDVQWWSEWLFSIANIQMP